MNSITAIPSDESRQHIVRLPVQPRNDAIDRGCGRSKSAMPDSYLVLAGDLECLFRGQFVRARWGGMAWLSKEVPRRCKGPTQFPGPLILPEYHRVGIGIRKIEHHYRRLARE